MPLMRSMLQPWRLAGEGTPGMRARYGPTYYDAFVIDLDGYKLEAHHP